MRWQSNLNELQQKDSNAYFKLFINQTKTTMEIVKSRYGLDRSIQRVDFQRLRVMGESQMVRQSKGRDGSTTLFDYEGGPCYTVGGKLHFEKMNWKIVGIKPYPNSNEGLHECILSVLPIY